MILFFSWSGDVVVGYWVLLLCYLKVLVGLVGGVLL